MSMKCRNCCGSGDYHEYDDEGNVVRLVTCERCGGSGYISDDDPEVIKEREEERRYGKRFYQRGKLW